MRWTTLPVSALISLAALNAVAQAPKASPAPVPPPSQLPPLSPAAPTSPGAIIIQYKLDLLDKDRDGFVSRAEAAGTPDLLKVFGKVDRNRDGKLDESELTEHNKQALGAK